MEICSFLKEIHNFMKFLIRKIQLDAKAPHLFTSMNSNLIADRNVKIHLPEIQLLWVFN